MLAALLVVVPLLAAAAVGEGTSVQPSPGGGAARHTTELVLARQAPPMPITAPFSVVPSASPLAIFAPTVAPPLVTAPTPVQPPPEAALGLCPEAFSINVVDSELLGAVLAGSDLLAGYFGCHKFRIDGTGVPIRFGEITPIFNARVLGYTDSTGTANEIWLNRDCWGAVGSWDAVVAHELGHYLGWQHGDDHPYMWLTPPAGSHIDPGNLSIVC